MPDRSAARLSALLAAIALSLACTASAAGQAGVSYRIPPDNPFVNAAGARPEIYVYGMRNPYRWSFDRLTGDMYVGDVGGQNEEITFIPRGSQARANLGWNCFSGTAVQSGCTAVGHILPAFEYPSGPDVVIGGYVIRDPTLAAFAGRYLYGRFDSGLRLLGVHAEPPDAGTASDTVSITSIGEDGLGRLYATSIGGGLYRLVQNGSALDDVKVGEFTQPLAVAAPPGDPDRLFVIEQAGRVKNRDGSLFLDLTGLVLDGGEQGLLGMAVAPDFATSGRVFVYYTDRGGDLQLDEFVRTATGPDRSELSTRRPILTVQHDQAANHNGGQLQFGPDGMLYLSTGDGGTQGDPEGDAQSLGSLLGKILRLDVSNHGAASLPPPRAGSPAYAVPPVLTARVPRRQRVLRLRGAVARLRCDEPCSLAAGGTLRLGRHRLRMRPARAAAAGGETRRMKARLTRRGRRALRRTLRSGRRASVVLRLRAVDVAGNRSPTLRRRVRVAR
ncbi:MAG TPA: PQQ-dependent sugar dehydrogenase [Thermoleophilaceae bacterium]|nr:PQQ-dependent sugar dehydrogenase [Thermoleophilaceae bacterium]